MSATVIRAILETTLAAMSPALATAWENAPYKPIEGTPYQRVHLLMAQPRSMEASQHIHREQGFLQINLCYPLGAGTIAAATRAELIRSTFRPARALTSEGITVTIDGLPEIAPAAVEDDRYVVPVRVRFFAHITRS